MDIVKLDENTFREVLSRAERILRSGGIIVAPTDTVYGIMGDATNEETIKKIFEMKRRPKDKAFPIFVKDISAAQKLAYISDAKTKFLEKVWPGPVTVVLHHKDKLPPVLTGGSPTIGVRITDHDFLLKLLAKLTFPLVQTSVNISGKPAATNLSEVKNYFEKNEIRPDLMVDVGELEGKPSTVIDFTGEGPMVLRTGPISKDELDRLLSSF